MHLSQQETTNMLVVSTHLRQWETTNDWYHHLLTRLNGTRLIASCLYPSRREMTSIFMRMSNAPFLMRDDHCVRTCPNGRHQYILRQCRHTRPKSKRPVGYMYVYALVLNGRWPVYLYYVYAPVLTCLTGTTSIIIASVLRETTNILC